MANESTISKWGDSLAVRIPLALVRQANLGEGDCVTMDLDSEGAIDSRPVQRKCGLAELVARIMPKNCHRETGWGRSEGRESW